MPAPGCTPYFKVDWRSGIFFFFGGGFNPRLAAVPAFMAVARRLEPDAVHAWVSTLGCFCVPPSQQIAIAGDADANGEIEPDEWATIVANVKRNTIKDDSNIARIHFDVMAKGAASIPTQEYVSPGCPQVVPRLFGCFCRRHRLSSDDRRDSHIKGA